MLNYESQNFKTLDQLRETVPSIFTKIPSSSTSKKYTHIPTDKVIKDLELLGWGVVDAKQVAARIESTQGVQKHLVVFRNNDVVINGKDGDTVYPQILLTNSHDGKNSFSFQAGLFRMICENGLVIATKQFENYKIRHMGYDFETLQGVIKDMISNLDLTVESMNKMKETELTEEQTFEFAKSLLNLRVRDGKNTFNNIAIKDVLTPQRKEDKGNGLWETFNRIQENIVEGNFQYLTPKGKLRQARPIKNFRQDMYINSRMYEQALTFAA
tara:strand:+ start:3644 stop:4453 length:810 start_codon:yes stop_codon:yes gene_type:complete